MTNTSCQFAALDVVGLIPAGGQATRISPLPMSKELYPIGFQAGGSLGKVFPKVVSHYLLEKMHGAGIRQAFIIVRPGKWDIPAYFGDGAMVDIRLAYLTVHVSYGVPYTLDQAYPFIKTARVALGFPDILFTPEDAFAKVLARQSKCQADVVLGLFPTTQYQKAGMVDVDDQGRVHQIIEKPTFTELRYMWAIAVWAPSFTQFMHDYLAAIPSERWQPSGGATGGNRELPIGDVIQAAIAQGLRVEAEIFPDGTYLDVGTPDDLASAIRTLTS
jgi:glucose-1-phosphate thymidylyltransferase